MTMRVKILFLLIINALLLTKQMQAQNPGSAVVCNSYQIYLIEDLGCGNFKFRKDCDLETIWNWGDGSKTTSKNEFMVHKYCKKGRYLVSISLSQSPNIIRHSLYVDVFDDATLNYTYTILSQVDCEKAVVKFDGLANCIESYDENGILIPGSDQILWDFGDGTTSTDVSPKHTFTSGGNFHVTLKSVSSTCDLEETKVINLGDPVTCCLDNVVFDHINWTPSESAVFNGNTFKIKSELRIKPGVELTFNNARLEMGKDARIIVERGATLNLNGTTVSTTSCGGYVWEGIEVWGGGDFNSQSSAANPFSPTGNLYVYNSIIENADEAITVARKRSLAFFDIQPGYNGGKIDVNNSTFKNNYTSINIWPYKACQNALLPDSCDDCNKYKNLSRIEANTFLCNAPMRDEKYTTYASESSTVPIRLGVNHFIYINGNYNMIIKNNDYINIYYTAPIKFRGSGVVLVNSDVSVTNLNVNVGKRFRGLTTGIKVSADNSLCKSTYISNYLFSGCQVAIDANSTQIEIINNQISIPNTILPLTAQGIHTRNCRDFKIRQNIINGISVGNKYGVLLRNNRSGELINNTFNNLFVGSQSEFINNGIILNCNYYQNQNFSIVVPNGRIANQGSISLSAGNEFMDPCKSISQNLNHIRSNIKFEYYYYPIGNRNPLCKSNIVITKTSSKDSECDYTEPLPPCSPNCTKDMYVQNIQTALLNKNQEEYNRLQNELRQVLLAMEGGFEVYMTYLDSISFTDLDAAMQLAGTYLNEGKTNDLSQVIDRIRNFDNEEAYSYAQLMKVLQHANTESRALHELNDEEVLVLNDLAMNDTTNASYIAEGILYQLYGYDYNHNPLAWNEGNRVQKEEEGSSEELIILPNPAKDWLTIKLDGAAINSLYIYNILGELVYEQNSIVDAEITIDASTLSKGLYTIKVKTQEKLLTQKLLIE